MKKIELIILLFLYLPTFAQKQTELKINITGYSSLKGDIYIAIYNSKELYMKPEKAVYAGIIQPMPNTTTYTIAAMPDGIYAATVFHDKNKNGKLDFNFIGIPKEKIGFSNNAKGFFGAPSFNETKFYHKGNQEISIKLE